MRMHCPHCGQPANVRSSRVISPTTREAYLQCSGLACGFTFVAMLEAVRGLSPSGAPNPEIKLPMPEVPAPPPKQLTHRMIRTSFEGVRLM